MLPFRSLSLFSSSISMTDSSLFKAKKVSALKNGGALWWVGAQDIDT
ncbi:hypothetical protein KIPB_012001, partial [Kipferlia bialata]|eukprot:g12001.t1